VDQGGRTVLRGVVVEDLHLAVLDDDLDFLNAVASQANFEVELVIASRQLEFTRIFLGPALFDDPFVDAVAPNHSFVRHLKHQLVLGFDRDCVH